MTTSISKLSFLLVIVGFASVTSEPNAHHNIRHETPRLRPKESFNQGDFRVVQPAEELPEIVETEEDDADSELVDMYDLGVFMSMPTMGPSDFPSDVPSDVPSDSPSDLPSDQPSMVPTSAPTTLTLMPTVSTQPSLAPSVSQAPTPTEPVPTMSPSSAPSSTPSKQPSSAPSSLPSTGPTQPESQAPSSPPSGSIKNVEESPVPVTNAPTTAPSGGPTDGPTSEPTVAPSAAPSTLPSSFPTPEPTLEVCNVTAGTREQQILELLRSVADPALIEDPDAAQGQATFWLLNGDSRLICATDEKILQRWVLAVVYFSTGGDEWLQCSDSIAAIDSCGTEEPFEGKQRFLSAFNECEWAGIACNTDLCVTEIEFELNNLVGTIPTEIGLLTHLERWGMERGRLSSTIPTEIEKLTNLYFLDLDFNQLTGTLTTQLYSLNNLEQLDLNNNRFSGPIDGIGSYPKMVFLQLHDNSFSGTVPSEVGTFQNLEAFTLHETDISGTMPSNVCNLLNSKLESLIADCLGNNPDVDCPCCTDCRLD